ncbi:MAG: hypothetical protein JSW26_08790, partial [Desulfobacterales bacterium]
MQLLDAAIAFALTIAGLATVVSIVIEIIHRVLSLRSKGLRAMLEQHFDDVIVPVIEKHVEKAIKGTDRQIEDELKRLRNDLIDNMTGNPLVILQNLSWLPKRAVNALSRYNEVTALDFIKRLPETEVFKYIKLRGNMTVDARLKKFDQKYEEYEKAISNYFKRRAQLLSFVVGIALAIGINIHGIRLFERYLTDPELTATVIAQTENIESAMESMQKRQTSDSKADQENIAEIKTALGQYQELMGNFMSLGLPIGWDFYPNCPLDQNPENLKYFDSQCKTAMSSPTKSTADSKSHSTLINIIKTGLRDPWGFLKWLFVVAITGTLIGLGGPFWFDVARKLSDVRRKFRNGSGPAEAGKPEPP